MMALRFEAANKVILKDFTYEFEKGDRVGIVGPSTWEGWGIHAVRLNR
jgi:ABC-type polysaccharide/polyol phosphate transport system ATPase subunit